MRFKDFAVGVLKFGVAFGLIGYMINTGRLDLSVMAKLLSPGFIILGLILAGLDLLLLGARWQILLKARNFPTRFRESFSLYLIGVFFNYALPGSIGGDVVKAYYIAQDHPRRRMEAVMSVVIDRILGLYSMVILALIPIVANLNFILAHRDLTVVAVMSVLLFSIMSVFLALAFSRRVKDVVPIDRFFAKMPMGQSLIKAFDAAHAYGGNKKVIVQSVLLSAVAQIFGIAFMVMVGYAVGESQISLATYFFAVPLGFIVSSVPIAPAGLGVGQVAFLVLFQMYSGEKSILGQTAITAFQVALLAWGLIGAFFYMKRKRPQLSEVVG